MKTMIRNTALFASLLFAGAGFAQDKPAGAPPPATEQQMEETKWNIPALAAELELTEAQVAKVKELEAKYEGQFESFKALSREEKATKVNQALAERNRTFSSLLTPEQAQKWQALKTEHKQSKEVEAAPAE